MRNSTRRITASTTTSLGHLLALLVSFGYLNGTAEAKDFPVVSRNWQAAYLHQTKPSPPAKRGPPPEDWDGRIPLLVTNGCGSTIWPGITSQAGTGPGIGGFELEAGEQRQLWVSPDWQGRVWGRTNCTVDGDSCSCETGDCRGLLDCEFSGATPATLAEFTLAGGINGAQTFYDISLVDGYNIPIGINYIPAENTTFIPPNLTNCACIATTGWLHDPATTGTYSTNSTYPVPLEDTGSNANIRNWCPWPYLVFPPTKPGDGIYPYPDDHIERPAFSPCNSACSATGSDRDCCVGDYHDPDVCEPSAYSRSIKAICPDAYSFAFDDQQSTFIIPNGGGWEVVMCPTGRSTDILRQLGSEMNELANAGRLSDSAMRRLRDPTYIEANRGTGSEVRPVATVVAVTALIVAVLLSV